MNDVTKLPKWAQRRIRVLEMRVRERDEKITAMSSNDGPIVWDRYSETELRLPKRNVDFCFGSDWDAPRNKIGVIMLESGLYINGSDGLIVEPLVSNAVNVLLKRFEP